MRQMTIFAKRGRCPVLFAKDASILSKGVQMRKFILPMLCLLLIFGCSITLGGCAPEETGAGDWLKWCFNQDSGLPVYEVQWLSTDSTRRWRSILTIMLLLISLPTAEADLMFAQGYIHAMERIFRWI